VQGAIGGLCADGQRPRKKSDQLLGPVRARQPGAVQRRPFREAAAERWMRSTDPRESTTDLAAHGLPQPFRRITRRPDTAAESIGRRKLAGDQLDLSARGRRGRRLLRPLRPQAPGGDRQGVLCISPIARGSEQVEARTGVRPAEMLVDGGYAQHEAIDQAAEQEVVLYAPVPKPRRGDTRDPHAPRPDDSPAVAAWRARMGTEEAKALYKQRAATAETVNADAKAHRGFDRLTVHGLDKVLGSASLFALTYNILRLITLGG
jgi:hypothetical protein